MNVASFVSCIALAMSFASVGVASANPCASCEAPCVAPCAPCVQQTCVVDDASPSWIFRRSTYTHDPETGARVAQYVRLPAVEPLEDERMVTSRYHRTRTNLRGTGGSVESYYDVQSWGNGRGGIDAEWERFHDAWKESFLQGGYYNQAPGYGNGYPGQFGYGGPGYGYGYPGNGFPGGGFPGGGYYGGPGNWGNQGPWHGGNNHGQHDGHGDHGDDGHDGDGH